MTGRAASRIALAAIVAALGCHRESPEDVVTETAVPVSTVTVRTGSIRAIIHAGGLVQPAPGADLTITAPEQARIAEIPKAEGDRVRRGDVLVRFDVPTVTADRASRRAEVERADSRVATATAAARRARELFDRGVAARREVEDADQMLADARAALEQARAAERAAGAIASRTVVRASFDGLVVRRLHNPGDLVEPTAADVILRVIDPRRLEVVAAVLIGDLERVRVGAGATATFGGAETRAALRVLSRPAVVDPATASAPVRLAFDQPVTLAAGTPVQVAIEAEQHDRVVIAPASAVLRDGDEAAVFVVGPDEKAHKHLVTQGLSAGDRVEIVSGLRDGDRVIVRGQAGLPDGAAVTITP